MSSQQANAHLWVKFPDVHGKMISANVKVSVPIKPSVPQLTVEETSFLVKATVGNYIRLVRSLQTADASTLHGENGISASAKFGLQFSKVLPLGHEPIVTVWAKGEHIETINPHPLTPILTNEDQPINLFNYASGLWLAVAELEDTLLPDPPSQPSQPSQPQGNANPPPNPNQPNTQPAPPPQNGNIVAGTIANPRQVKFGKQTLIQDEIVQVDIVKIGHAMNKKGEPVYDLYGVYGNASARYPSVSIRPHSEQDWDAVGGFISSLNMTELGQERAGQWVYTAKINHNNSSGAVYWNPVKLEVK